MIRLVCALMLAALLLHAPARSPAVAQSAAQPSEAAVAAAYADAVVVPTYTLLAQRLGALRTAISTLRQSPTDANLQTARAAWVAARQPWEWSESFLFGPVSSLGLDPALDTWPISAESLTALLSESTPLDASSVAALEPDVKGYHSLEFLLFGEKGAKQAAALTPRELLYAELLATEMSEIGETLLRAWTSGVDGGPAFRTARPPRSRSCWPGSSRS
jgi:putative iron-regulated protein